MRLRMRLILSNTMLAIVASLLIGGTYKYYMERWYRSDVFSSTQFLANQLLNKFDSSINQMEQVALFILSDQDALQSIRNLSTMMKDPSNQLVEINEAKNMVKDNLYTAYNLENFYRVVVFNQYGYIMASANMQDRLVNTKKQVSEISWISQVENTRGKFVFLPLHKDDWGEKDDPETVFSLVKEIQGNKLGFIEIQQTEENLQKIFLVQDPDFQIIALDESGKILYVSEGANTSDYTQYFDAEVGISEMVNSQTGVKEMISVSESKESGIRLILIKDWKDVVDSMANAICMAIMIGIGFFVSFIVFIIVTANLLTRPLRTLRKQMEHTKWSNMDEDIEIQSKDEDIQALTMAYKDLLKRLSNSLEKEKQLSILQLQAQFDTLQAQVNPHFLYNVLNVISNRGMMNDDEVICEICGNLATMLRYATNTTERYATIEQEVQYLKNYVYLLRARYEDRLQIEININPAIYKEIVPKIMLQQLVENSIEHGYKNKTQEMVIQVIGYMTKAGWTIEVRDNGDGIELEQIDALKQRMALIRKKLERKSQNLEMEIGGMGIANTYGRMFLLYQEDALLRITNQQNGTGAIAYIGVDKCIQ